MMQSDGNSVCGDVVFHRFNRASEDEDNILNQILKKQICLDLYYEDFGFHNISRKFIIT